MSEIEHTADGPISPNPDEDKKLSDVVAAFELGRQFASIPTRDDTYLAGFTDGMVFAMKPELPSPYRSTNFCHGAPRRRSLTHPKGRAR